MGVSERGKVCCSDSFLRAVCCYISFFSVSVKQPQKTMTNFSVEYSSLKSQTWGFSAREAFQLLRLEKFILWKSGNALELPRE